MFRELVPNGVWTSEVNRQLMPDRIFYCRRVVRRHIVDCSFCRSVGHTSFNAFLYHFSLTSFDQAR